jgi:hypothetical protein
MRFCVIDACGLRVQTIGYVVVQYVLKEPRGGEKIQGHSRVVDSLISAIGLWQSQEPDALYVFDRYWYRDVALWKEVQRASWDKVILDPKMKKELVSVCDTFFDSKDIYEEYGVPWKRGLIFHGPPGNGKFIIEASKHCILSLMLTRQNDLNQGVNAFDVPAQGQGTMPVCQGCGEHIPDRLDVCFSTSRSTMPTHFGRHRNHRHCPHPVFFL